MRKKIGPALKRLRSGKGYKRNRFYHDICSKSQLHKFECSETMLSSDKLLKILTRLNTNSNEFMLLTDYAYARSKIEIEGQLNKALKHHQLEDLKQIAQFAKDYHRQYGGCYFNHTKSLALAIVASVEDINIAREHLEPVQEYLFEAEIWYCYEVQLALRCLPICTVDKALEYGNKALQSIEENPLLYHNTEIVCELLTNLSIYLLDYPKYVSKALKHALELEEYASTNHLIYAKIIQQIAFHKLKHKKFNMDYLQSLLDTLKLIGLDYDLQYVQALIDKHLVSKP